ncbi:hypothetical protein WR25_17921 [Diploscapter pachys]|uniref:Uncharacterized protein n=1 Tax=Diploscapter pachys TaxID=2018661 RepID=A0A2A2KEM0_9BILA|nr:hypothetical protein WR25_17921 [Diploscapter pachys]
MFCCTRMRRKKRDGCLYAGSEVLCSKKGLFSLMLARLDEFDSLTPLISTPSASNASDSLITQQPQLLKSIVRSSSDSPPPPRRPLSGTLIVPLNSSKSAKYRPPLGPPLLGTPDSRITSFEGGTRSCATIPEIPEDDEDAKELLSIDRTSVSLLSDRRIAPRGFYFYHSGYNLTLPQQPPEYQLPAPTYSPPSAPIESIHRLSPQQPHSLASDPSTGSPVDTTASLSDSFYINSDVISSAAGSQTIDTGSGAITFEPILISSTVGEAIILDGSDVEGNKYPLHRIEEEVEGEDRIDESQAMPRSVSQQQANVTILSPHDLPSPLPASTRRQPMELESLPSVEFAITRNSTTKFATTKLATTKLAATELAATTKLATTCAVSSEYGYLTGTNCSTEMEGNKEDKLSKTINSKEKNERTSVRMSTARVRKQMMRLTSATAIGAILTSKEENIFVFFLGNNSYRFNPEQGEQNVGSFEQMLAAHHMHLPVLAQQTFVVVDDAQIFVILILGTRVDIACKSREFPLRHIPIRPAVGAERVSLFRQFVGQSVARNCVWSWK